MVAIQQPTRAFHNRSIDHLPVELKGTESTRRGIFGAGEHAPGPVQVICSWAEYLIDDLELHRMDTGLRSEAKRAHEFALREQPRRVTYMHIDAVDGGGQARDGRFKHEPGARKEEFLTIRSLKQVEVEPKVDRSQHQSRDEWRDSCFSHRCQTLGRFNQSNHRNLKVCCLACFLWGCFWEHNCIDTECRGAWNVLNGSDADESKEAGWVGTGKHRLHDFVCICELRRWNAVFPVRNYGVCCACKRVPQLPLVMARSEK